MTAADIVLTLVLIVALPGYMLTRSLKRRAETPGGERVRRYRHTIALVALPLVAVTALWLGNDRPIVWLGLGPPDRIGGVLVMVAVLLIVSFAVLAPRARRSTDTARHAEAALMMPQGSRETLWFLAFALAVGAGWEILYRGYLWWVLAPALGAPAAVAIMALSYGVAHGYRGAGALIGSIVSALLFAGGYALTHSLWWLIVIHVGLPLVGLRLRPVVRA